MDWLLEIDAAFTRAQVEGHRQAARNLEFFAEVWNIRKRR
jgi:hypothetical protein